MMDTETEMVKQLINLLDNKTIETIKPKTAATTIALIWGHHQQQNQAKNAMSHQ